MKYLILYSFFFSLLLGCTPNPSFDKLELILSPAFTKPTTFRIDLEKQVFEIEKLDIRYTYDESSIKDFDEIISQDTVEILYQESFQIPPKALWEFVRVVQSIELDTSIFHEREALDGSNFYFSKIKKEVDTTYLISQRPVRTPVYEKDFCILDAFFTLAYATITEDKGIRIVEDNHNKFSDELLIRKVADDPLEFRIVGNVLYCRREVKAAFNTFLETLPQDEPIIFDMRNNGYYPCPPDRLQELFEFPNVYFYGNTEMLSLNKPVHLPQRSLDIRYLYITNTIRPRLNLNFDFWMIESTKRVFKTKHQLLEVLKFNNLI